MKKRNSGPGRIISLGLISLPLLGWLFMTRLKKPNPRNAMTTINNIGYAVYNDLVNMAKFNPETAKKITAQAAHETGNFTSEIFTEQNNLFGMKHPRIRKTLSLGEKRGHAVFASVQDSIKDYKIYYTVFSYLPFYSSVSTFVEALNSRGYFTAPKAEYKKAVEYFHELYFPKT